MNYAIVLSGGRGSRLGAEIPKQYIEVGGMPIISYCLRALLSHPDIDEIVIVAEKEWQDLIAEQMKKLGARKAYLFAEPGENRQLSILSGLTALKEKADPKATVLIHDAARPMLTSGIIDACLQGMEGHDGAMPVLPMKDTVYRSIDGKIVSELLDRSQIYAGQAPEIFLYGKYLEANENLTKEKLLTVNGSTEPAIRAGMDIAMIPGDERNFKITTGADLIRFQNLIAND